MFKTILVHVDRDSGSDERTRLAIGLARRYNAALIGLTAGLPRLPVEFYADGLGVIAAGNDFTELDRKELEAEFGLAAKSFAKATEGFGLKTEWRSSMGIPSNAVVAASNAADLIIVGRGDKTVFGDYRTTSAGDVLMRSGRPVLTVPTGLSELTVKNVVVAWKDTREARRAIVDALPFMKEAAHTHLFHIDEGEGALESLKDVQAALARHQVTAKITSEPRGDGPIEEQILQFALRTQTDLIVAGAYGHTRFREWVFGGMTRGLLNNCPIACLMSH